MNDTSWVVLDPLDTVTVRDGRSFTAGLHATARTTPPRPSTIAGAIGAAFRSNPAEVRGPVVVRRSTERWHAYFPAPRDVVRDDYGQPALLEPEPDGAGAVKDDLGMPAPPRGEGTWIGGWWSDVQLERYLNGRRSVSQWLTDREPWVPWASERRTGLARSADRTAIEGFLYSIDHLMPAPDVAFAAQCVDLPSGRVERTVRFGGESRRAEVTTLASLDPTSPVWPAGPGAFPGGRLLIYLATPAVFAGGWRLDTESLGGGAEVVSAVVEGPEVVTTAAVDPRTAEVRVSQLLWAVSAGSVYFLQFPSADAALEAAQRWHGRALPQAEDLYRTAGFGVALVGGW